MVWLALAVSAVAVGCCLLLAVLPRRWRAVIGRRRRPDQRARRAPGGPPTPAAAGRRALADGPPGAGHRGGAAPRAPEAPGSPAPPTGGPEVPDGPLIAPRFWPVARTSGGVEHTGGRRAGRGRAPWGRSSRPGRPRSEPASTPRAHRVGPAPSEGPGRDGAAAPGDEPGPGSGPLATPTPAPRLTWPVANRGRRPAWWAVVVIALVTGGLAAAISSRLVGLAAGLVTLGALVVPQARALTAVLAVGLLAAAAVSVVKGQAQHPIPESSNWAGAFDNAGVMVEMAVVFWGPTPWWTPPAA